MKTINVSDDVFAFIKRAVEMDIDMRNDLAWEEVESANLFPRENNESVSVITTEVAPKLRAEIGGMMKAAVLRHKVAEAMGIKLNDEGYTI